MQGQRRRERLADTRAGKFGLYCVERARKRGFIHHQHLCRHRRSRTQEPTGDLQGFKIQSRREGAGVRVRFRKKSRSLCRAETSDFRHGREAERKDPRNGGGGVFGFCLRRANRRRKRRFRGIADARMSENEKFRQNTGRLQPFLFLLRHSLSAGQEPFEKRGKRGKGDFGKQRAGNRGDGHRYFLLSRRKRPGTLRR